MNEKDIDRIADKILEKIRNDKKMKAEKQLTPFQKTEKLLSELSLLKGAIDSKNMLIEDLKKEGITIRKREIGVNVQSSKAYLSELEEMSRKYNENQENIKEYQNKILEIMGIFLSIFSLIGINISFFHNVGNIGILEIVFLAIMINLILVTSIKTIFDLIDKKIKNENQKGTK